MIRQNKMLLESMNHELLIDAVETHDNIGMIIEIDNGKVTGYDFEEVN